METLQALLPFALIILVFWFLIIRPTRKRQRALTEMREQISVGDQVMLTCGIAGTVHRADGGEHVGVEIAPGVVVTAVVAAIATREPIGSPQDDADDE
ncbi:MAG: preprotein translocase subunit YajC [Actinobacteria bacterium]|nr:preprotein translocase subunit YajC [Actinomycetota bacterium]